MFYLILLDVFMNVSLATGILNLKLSRILTVSTGHSFLVGIRLQVAMQRSSQPMKDSDVLPGQDINSGMS